MLVRWFDYLLVCLSLSAVWLVVVICWLSLFVVVDVVVIVVFCCC